MTKISRYSIVVCLLVVGLVAFSAGDAYAAAGSLDPTFGTGGIAVTSVNGPAGADVLVQPDGKLVVIAGFNNDPSATEAFGVLRYRSDGALDTGFGSQGRATVAFTNFINSASDGVLQPDGKLVVVGETESADGTLSAFAIARLNPNGSLDAGFGTGGKVTTNFVGVQPGGVRNPATAVLVQPDGKILVGGSASQCAKCGTKTALARYLPNGTLDATFGAGGTVSVTAIGRVSTLAEDSTGDIFALSGSVIAQFSPAGALQAAVTAAPVVVASSAGFQVAPAVFRPDGRFLVARTVSAGTGYRRRDIDTQVVRFQPSGAVDPSWQNPPFDFSDDGTVASDVAQALTAQPDGKVIVAGVHSFNGQSTFGVARLGEGGALDPAFGTGGALTTTLTGSAQASAVLVQPDGKIVVVGQTFDGDSTNLVLVRYLSR